MIRLAPDIAYLDLEFTGRPRVIATAILQHPTGITIVDPGPSTSLPVLERKLAAGGLSLADVSAIFLTHVHLDHAGAVGTLVAGNPGLEVFVHEKGAPHLANPDKLIASAARLYGDDMARLWGEIRPVPPANVRALGGGEVLEAGGRRWEVAYTPGHASHHVCFFNSDSGIAFVGDTGGVKLAEDGYVLPPTPPPDIDVDAWRESLARIEAWRPHTLFLTHFGPYGPAEPHVAALRRNLDALSRIGRASLEQEGDDRARAQWFARELAREVSAASGEDAATFSAAARSDLNWKGLARYWCKRAERGVD